MQVLFTNVKPLMQLVQFNVVGLTYVLELQF